MRRLFDTRDSVADIVSEIPPAYGQSIRDAGRHFVECLAARDSGACARLPADAVDNCRVESAQIRARIAGDRGWAMPEEMMAMCRTAASEADCQRYGQAIETGNRDLCNGLPAQAADCPALAAGDPELCSHIPQADRSCAEQAANFARLRRGARELLGTRGRFQTYVRGAFEGPASCQNAARTELSTIMDAAARAPAPSEPPQPRSGNVQPVANP